VFTTNTESGEISSVPIPITSRKLQDSQRTSRRLTLADPMLYLQCKVAPGFRLPFSEFPGSTSKSSGVPLLLFLLLPGTILLLLVPTLMCGVSLE
jgi:hypothetical protein